MCGDGDGGTGAAKARPGRWNEHAHERAVMGREDEGGRG